MTVKILIMFKFDELSESSKVHAISIVKLRTLSRTSVDLSDKDITDVIKYYNYDFKEDGRICIH